ncbi:MAG: hypothetical protein M0R17_01460 [Candidatus Omnitrophica bacterium]|jgi:hypothetical protein|nr:hypothetical protein [Candidatus Omnitrophota bacterium]
MSTYTLAAFTNTTKKSSFQTKRAGLKPTAGDVVTLIYDDSKDLRVRKNTAANFYELIVTKKNYTDVMS